MKDKEKTGTWLVGLLGKDPLVAYEAEIDALRFANNHNYLQLDKEKEDRDIAFAQYIGRYKDE